MDLRLNKEQPHGEYAARILHIVIGLAFVGFASWQLFFAPQFNPYAFWGVLVFGFIPLLVGIFGNRKTVIQLLFCGWV